MGGKDTHDMSGRPYELDDSKEHLYDKLDEARQNIDWLMSGVERFQEYLKKEFQECSEDKSAINIELAVINDVMKNFVECFHLNNS